MREYELKILQSLHAKTPVVAVFRERVSELKAMKNDGTDLEKNPVEIPE